MQIINVIDKNLKELANNVHKNEILASLLIHTESLISELHIDMNEIIESIALGKHGIINPQFVDADQFLATLKQITNKNKHITNKSHHTRVSKFPNVIRYQ